MIMVISLDTKHISPPVNEHEFAGMKPMVATAHKMLHEKSGLGSDYLGWVTLPEDISQDEISQIKTAAEKIRKSCDVFLVIGIGGSYLGARAAIEYLKSPLYNQLRDDNTPEIYFIGNSISGSYLSEVLSLCENKDVCINVISKSGTTTEPALAFRVLREKLIAKYGETEAAQRIFCTTDKSKGTLKELADKSGYETFVIPDNVGGRFSVLTPVGLLPIAVAGSDIEKLITGAKKAQKQYAEPDIEKNDCYKYAAARNIMKNKGKSIEVLVSYEPALTLFGEWFKQLFGESEGKDQKGIFPAAMTFSTDLHSLGQFVQDGSRTMFETVVNIENPAVDIKIKPDPENFDGLNFLAGMTYDEVNKKAMAGTIIAHTDGGTPNMVLNVPSRDEDSLGQLFYFFEKACAISGYLQGVNPFDQPGVEEYKQNMFALLGKPGFEERKKELEKQL